MLDVGALLAGRDPVELTVNGVDAHPNEAVHQEIARQLYQILQTDLQEFSK